MKVLLTGGSGLLGQALLPILNKTWEIFSITRTPLAPGSSKSSNVKVILHDLTYPLDFSKLPPKIDAVLHIAQSLEYKRFPDAAPNIFNINTLAAFQMMEYARQAKAKFFLYTSTGNIYENNYAMTSEDSKLSPHSFYSATKLASEILLNTYKPFYSICIMRLFFLYGKQQQKDKLIYSLANKIKNRVPVSIAGQYGLKFTPTYNHDVATIIAKAMSEQWEGCINVATSETITIKDLSLKIGTLLGVEPIFQYTDDSYPTCIIPDLTKLSQFYPEMKFTSLDDGLSHTFSTETN